MMVYAAACKMINMTDYLTLYEVRIDSIVFTSFIFLLRYTLFRTSLVFRVKTNNNFYNIILNFKIR